MPRQSELFQRAAECDRLVNDEPDPIRKQTLKYVRDMWIALANECASMPAHKLEADIASLESIQADLTPKPTLQ